MARKFITDKEAAFIHRVNKELIQRVIGQEVYYYAILAEKTKAHDLYNESVQKVWSAPVVANALVYYENSTEQVTSVAPDSKFNLDIYFHKYELEERKMVPRMGDFVLFGEVLFEIFSVTEPQMIFGQIERKMMVKCVCGPARKGQFAPPAPRTE
jgi:hypothetical protein